MRVREQQPLSSLSSVLLYRVDPKHLRLVFYDEVWELVAGGHEGERKARHWG